MAKMQNLETCCYFYSKFDSPLYSYVFKKETFFQIPLITCSIISWSLCFIFKRIHMVVAYFSTLEVELQYS